MNSISLIVIRLFRLFILEWDLIACLFRGNFLFHLTYRFHNKLFRIFLLKQNICRICNYVTSFSPDIFNLYALYFFIQIARSLLILFLFLKNEFSVSLIFSIVCLFSIALIYTLICNYTLLSAFFGYLLFFLFRFLMIKA